MIEGTPLRPSISPALPAAAALGLAAVAFARFGASGHGILVAFVCSVLIVIAAIDIEHHRIPNVIVVPASVVVLIGQALRSPSHVAGFLAYGCAAAGALLVLAAVYSAGLGMGDVKLAVLLGFALGSGVLLAVTLGFVAAGIFSLALLVTGRVERKTAIPLAPFLGLGTLAVLLIQ